MAFTPGKQNHSLKHISAKTPEALEQLMLEIAFQSPNTVTFSSPIYANAKWFSWYIYDWSSELPEHLKGN